MPTITGFECFPKLGQKVEADLLTLEYRDFQEHSPREYFKSLPPYGEMGVITPHF